MNWDTLLAALIIVGLLLGAWARMSRQTIPELLRGITDWIRDTREEANERGEELLYYD